MILITGGAGYIGSHVVKLLSKHGYKVVVFDNLSTGFADALLHDEKLIINDLANYSAIDAVMRDYPIDAVMHFAASVVVPESVVDPIKYYMNNTVNTLNLWRACVQHNVKHVIYSSTAAVYGSPILGIVDEESAIAPTNPYGSSKWLGEKLLQDIAAVNDIRFVCLRYFNVAGADPLGRIGQRTPNATHLIKVACQAALGLRESVSIYGTDYPTPDGTGIRDYVHVEDLAAAHLAALHYLESQKSSVTLNVGYGHGASVKEVIHLVKQISGQDFPVVFAPRRPGDSAKVIANADKIRSTLGWVPQFASLSTIIANALQWEEQMARSTVMAG